MKLKQVFPIFGFVPFLIFILSCGEKEKSIQEYLGYEYAENNHSLLWEISGNGLKTPSYLYGTIHIQRKEVFAYDSIVQKIFDTCSAYAMEISMDEVNPIKAAKMMMLEKPLDQLISPEKYARIDSFFRAETGIGIGLRKTTKPFFLMAQLMQKDIGSDMEMALDLYFFNMAKDQKKKTIGIEKFEEQMAAVDQLTVDEQVDLILKGLGDTTSSMAKFDDLIKVYLEGDLDKMIELSTDTMYPPKFNQAFLIDRNVHMAERIGKHCKDQMTFCAIGAAHLGGPQGVIELMKKDGFTLKPIKTSFRKP